MHSEDQGPKRAVENGWMNLKDNSPCNIILEIQQSKENLKDNRLISEEQN